MKNSSIEGTPEKITRIYKNVTDSFENAVEKEDLDDTGQFSYKIVLVGNLLFNNPSLEKALQVHMEEHPKVKLDVVAEDKLADYIVKSEKNELENSETLGEIFVLDDFESVEYDILKQNNRRILGPTCVLDIFDRCLSLNTFTITRVYSLSLFKAIVVFSGFEKERRSELSRLTKLAHHMGARVKLEINKSVTHLVACNVNSSLYEDSIGLGIDVVGVDWLYHCWQQRHDALFCGTNSETTNMFRVKPFTGLSIAFYAFKGSEKKQMEEIAVTNGATIVEISSPLVSHIVIDDVVKSDFVIASRDNVWLVTSQWFWKSVQFQVHYSENPYVVPHIENKKKKQPNDQKSPMRKLQSPNTQKKSPLSAIFSIGRKSKENSLQEERPEILSKRKLLLMELLSTEKTYVEILNTLIELFKNSIENPTEKLPPFLSKEEIKTVFGAIPDILKIHTNILEELEIINAKWREEPNIGSIFVKHVDPMIKAYTAFINYYEIIKSTIEKRAAENQCFHAFLKICQSDSRCYRQSLCELLIRPVQRLPSLILILKGLLKETPSDSSDYVNVQKAIENITFVLNQVNEDKRRTEEQLMMVEMWNNIEDCPPHVMSASRRILLKFEAFEFQEMSKYKTKHVFVFLLSDSIEITRKRNNGIFKSSTVAANKNSPSMSSLTRNKSFKHCFYIPFNMIERIIEVPENSQSGWRNSFGLHTKNSETFEASTVFYQIIGDQAPNLITSIFDVVTKSSSCVKSIHKFSEINRADSGKSFKHPESPIISIGRALENLAAKASRRMSRAFSINGSNGLPRSISVASQITTDSISSSKLVNNKTSSLHIDNISQMSDFENCPSIVNTSKMYKKKTISKVKEKTKKTLSLWRRSIQSSDIKKR